MDNPRSGAMDAVLGDAMRDVDALLQRGDYRGACDHLKAVIAAHPAYGEARRLLGGAQLALGDFASAEQTLRDALAVDPEWTPALTTLGEFLLARGRFAEAEQVLRRAVAARSPHLRAVVVLANYYGTSRRWDEVLQLVPRMDVDLGVPMALAEQRARALVACGREGAAIAESRAVVARSPADPAGAKLVALTLSMAHRDAEAEPLLGRALRRAPADLELLLARARSLTAMGQLAEAEAAWRAVLQRAPQDATAHNELARLVWLRSGDPAATLEALDTALQKFSNNDALWAARAAVLQAAGDPRAAWRCLAGREDLPGASPMLMVRAGLAALEFDSALALALADRAGKLAPGNMPAKRLRAAALLGVGDAQAALEELAGLRQVAPDDQYLVALQTTAWRILGDARYAQWCDYTALVVPYRLQAPAPWRHLDDFLADLRASLERMHATMAHRRLFQSLRHGTETTGDLTCSTDPVVQALFKAFDAPIRDYMARLGHGDDPLRRRNTRRYRFNGSWSVRLHTAGFHHNHVHPSGWISSACYIDLPASMAAPDARGGVLTFGEPGLLTQPALAAQHQVRPAPGMLVLFPSYVWHGTVPFTGTDVRLTVAFDAIPVT